MKDSNLTGASRALIAGLVWVYADVSNALDCSFFESSFAMGT